MSDQFDRFGRGNLEDLDTRDDAEDHGSSIECFLEHIDWVDRENRWHERFEAKSADLGDQGCDQTGPFIFELGDIRSLLANWGYVQSAMSIRDPFRLMLDYTRAMMAFLLFNPSPKSIEIIGLGGGSLAKYCHRFLPESSIRAVEIDWEVIALADRFCIPPASNRFEIICDDGADFVVKDGGRADIILVDGFDNGGQPSQLCSADFYRACRSRLNSNGILVVNLCGEHRKNLPIFNCLRDSFGDVVTVPAEAGMNLVVFARKGRSIRAERNHIVERAQTLQKNHALPLKSFALNLFD